MMEKSGVSILISTYNGALRIEQTLKSLSKIDILNLPFVELILIDNASTDNTLAIGIEIWERFGAPFPMIALSEKRPGKIYAQGKRIGKFKRKIHCYLR